MYLELESITACQCKILTSISPPVSFSFQTHLQLFVFVLAFRRIQIPFCFHTPLSRSAANEYHRPTSCLLLLPSKPLCSCSCSCFHFVTFTFHSVSVLHCHDQVQTSLRLEDADAVPLIQDAVEAAMADGSFASSLADAIADSAMAGTVDVNDLVCVEHLSICI